MLGIRKEISWQVFLDLSLICSQLNAVVVEQRLQVFLTVYHAVINASMK